MKSGIFSVCYRTEIMNAGMPMLALVCSMPMPSYDETILLNVMYMKKLYMYMSKLYI